MSEPALRRSIDENDPRPTIEIIAAVVQRFGVDPTWLVTGEYDASTHRAAIDDDTAMNPGQLADLVSRMMARSHPAFENGTKQLET